MSTEKRVESTLVDELLEESHGLRMKYEDFSRYTEGQVAEFVSTKRRLNQQVAELGQREGWLAEKVSQLEAARDHLVEQRDHVVGERDRALAERDRALAERDHVVGERDGLLVELAHARGDLELLNEQRAMVQRELVRITHECAALQEALASRTAQRDRWRERVRVLESARSYRLVQRVKRLLRRR
jgi:FtsZ-binding cell division protein ZapB